MGQDHAGRPSVAGQRILVVEDAVDIAALIRATLTQAGYAVEVAVDGPSGLKAALRHPPDLVLLDWNLPGMDGLEVCRQLRQLHGMPIIMLTAMAEISDRIAGLDAGADDYVVKPFDIHELQARVRAQLRQHQPSDHAALSFHDVVLTEATHAATRAGQTLALSPREFALLRLFLQHPEIVLGRERILNAVWGFDFDGEENILDVYVRYVRQKLEAAGGPRLIQTVRGIGYVLRLAE